MPVLLRIHHQKRDVIFQVLTDKPSIKSSLEVFLEGKTYLFVKTGNSWVIGEGEQEILDSSLINAVAKALALRFRITSAQHV